MCENKFKNSEEKKRKEDFNRLFAAAAVGVVKAIRETMHSQVKTNA